MKEIGTDFQGWPINAMTLREIIKKLGITYTLDNGDEIIRSDRKHLLDAYPIILEDDGMGYGVNPQYITIVDTNVYEDKGLKKNGFNIFVEPKTEEIKK